MNSYEKNTVIEKFEHYFDGVAPFDLGRVMVAVPTIQHRDTLSIDKLNFFPNRFIFIEESELELYKPEIDSGWIPIIRTAHSLPETRNQILQHFRNSNYEYLIMADDELQYRKVVVNNDTFQTVEVKEPEEMFKLELARMERDHIDVLTVPNTQYLTARIIDTILSDKSAVDYSFIVYTRRALLRNNYWYETFPETCEDQFMGKLLLSDPNLKCRYAIILRRDTQQNSNGSSTYGDTDGHKAWQDKTNDILEQLSAKGFTADLMNLLWKPEYRPTERYPLNYKRHKTYIQEKQEISKWKRFLM